MTGKYCVRPCPRSPAAEPSRVKIRPNPNTNATEWKKMVDRRTGSAAPGVEAGEDATLVGSTACVINSTPLIFCMDVAENHAPSESDELLYLSL
jgi:hypothetical protein